MNINIYMGQSESYSCENVRNIKGGSYMECLWVIILSKLCKISLGLEPALQASSN
jgi:hypothetical protein